MSIKSFLKFIYAKYLLSRKIHSCKKEAHRIATMPSYYPEKKRKPYEIRVKENKLWAQKYHEVNEFYNLYGFDVEESNSDGFVDYLHFMETRNYANQINRWGGSQIVLLRDKFLFFKYMRSNNLPVPDVIAIIINGKIYDCDFQEINFADMKEYEDYFVKDIDGECASYVKHIRNYEDLMTILDNLRSGNYIVQRKIEQHTEMSRINAGAINTLRIVTINKNGSPYVLSALLRVGTSKTGSVDNWAAGGLAIGIRKGGYLKHFGYYKPIYGIKTDEHPDSGIKFSDFQIPMYEEAEKIACEAHKAFYGLRAIGWDIAITENGPIFVEGNDNFEISLQQACDRPLKREWEEAIK